MQLIIRDLIYRSPLDNIKSDTTGQLEWKYNIYSNEELKATLSTVESLLNMSNTTIEEE